MDITAVDFYYLSMPEIQDIADGSQDALLVRVEAGEHFGWGECEAAPLVSLASWACPPSHSACKPVKDSVLGQRLDTAEDVRRINALVRKNSLDLLQTDHTLSGIDIALWDLLGRKHGVPVYHLLGYERAYPKTAYASLLFCDDAQTTLERAREVRQSGYTAAKFGWGPYGQGRVEDDADQIHAAREGLGPGARLLVDAGTVWKDDVDAARSRLPALEACNVTWLEEPFLTGALPSYRQLARESAKVRLAGGEGCHDFDQARNMIDDAGLGFVQIDAGRIGGITTAKQVADYARAQGVTFVNHTFTTHLALSASVQPYAGIEADALCEYPVQPTLLGRDLTRTRLTPDQNGQIHLGEGVGLGVEPDESVIKKYLVEVEIKVGGRVIYETPSI